VPPNAIRFAAVPIPPHSSSANPIELVHQHFASFGTSGSKPLCHFQLGVDWVRLAYFIRFLVMKLFHIDLNSRFDIDVVFTTNYFFSER
jgi:hypothetical protein